jgi:hypothetical protein
MAFNFEDLEGVASDLQQIDESGLSKVASLVRKQLALEARITDLEAELKAAKAQLDSISGDLLPAALSEHGLSQLKMADGSEVSVSRYYAASIPKDRAEEAFAWLQENDFADIVKNQISTSFGRNESNRANDLFHKLEQEGYAPSQKQWVEPMTLKAFVKEQVEAGREIPSDLFGIFIGEKAKIRRK